jgi:hypothetical protein
MKRSHLTTAQAIEDEEWEQMDQDDAKEVSLPPSELGKFLDAQAAFQGAGYRIRAAEIVQTHPFWVFHLTRTTAPRIQDGDEFLRHVRDILQGVGIYFKDDNAMIQRSGNRILVSFLWPTPARGTRRERAWDSGRFEKPLKRLPRKRR